MRECNEDPRKLLGQPIGMYHCPDCGCMVLAGLEHGPHDDGCWLNLDAIALLRRVLSEYLAGNRIVDGYWYSPDETGEPHYQNDAATAEEVALVDSLKAEVGL